MKTFNRDHLPESITHNNREYKRDISRTHLHNEHKLSTDNKRGCVLVKVRQKPYRPSEWIFCCMELAKTAKAYERYLNDLYADAITSYTQANEQLGHMVKNRPNKLFGGIPSLLIHYYNQQKLGTFVRKYGPIEFQTGYRSWQPQ